MNEAAFAIKTQSLSKKFGGGMRGKPVQALDDVSLEVSRGEIFGLLGPNGAGKTTMVKILLGALRPTSGAAFIEGIDCGRSQARRSVGFLPENHRFPSYLTGMQLLRVYGGMAGLSSAEIKSRSGPLLEMVGMSEWSGTRIKKYSKGMMQRLGLAQALLNDPELIFLDEPTDGVDPIGRREIRDILKRLKSEGKTIFLNSHLLAEVESVSDRVAILDKGKLIKVGPVAGLVQMRPIYRVQVGHVDETVIARVREYFPQASFEGIYIAVEVGEAKDINILIDLLRNMRVDIFAVMPATMSLEDSFVQLVKGGARE